MYKKIFLLDDIPTIKSVLDDTDHNSSIIFSFLNIPIFTRINNEFYSDIVIDASYKNIMELKFKKNKYNITSEDFYKTLKYILVNKTNYCSYLNFILGVKEYENGEVDFDSIKLWYDNDTIYAETYFNNDHYKSIFSSIHFSPQKIINNKLIDGFGEYFISKLHENKIVICSKVDNDIKILFKKVVDEKEQIEIIQHSKNAYSGFTSLNPSILKRFKCFKINSNLEFRLKVNNNCLNSKYFIDLKYEIISKCNQLDTVIDFFNIDNINYDNDHHVIFNKNNIKILYADYYPNNEIINVLKKILSKNNCTFEITKMNFKDFLKENSQTYDLILDIFEPIVINKIDNYISEINNFNSDEKSYFVKILNIFIENNFDSMHENAIKKYIYEKSNNIKLGNFKMYYMKSKETKELIFDDYNNLINY